MWRDEAYLLDMLIAARHALKFLDEASLEDFASDALRQSAVIRQLEIIGEAASKVSDEFRSLHPALPWTEIVGMRNRLIHEYRSVDVERVWHTVAQHIPELITHLGPLIPAEEELA